MRGIGRVLHWPGINRKPELSRGLLYSPSCSTYSLMDQRPQTTPLRWTLKLCCGQCCKKWKKKKGDSFAERYAQFAVVNLMSWGPFLSRIVSLLSAWSDLMQCNHSGWQWKLKNRSACIMHKKKNGNRVFFNFTWIVFFGFFLVFVQLEEGELQV